MESKDVRKKLLEDWLSAKCNMPVVRLCPMQGDASTRRYFRLNTPAASLVAMDAPPPTENCRPFVAIATALRRMGLKTPDVLEVELEQGFLLLSDFGDATYLNTLNAQNVEILYQKALDALATLQHCREVPGRNIPLFTADFMMQEWAWHKEWFLTKLLGLSFPHHEEELDRCYLRLVESAISQPQVFMHRDYHSANLMVLPDEVGILDFQDAFIGPVTYDVVSLLRDCYIDWERDQVERWALAYWQRLRDRGMLQEVAAEKFLRWFDWMGLQRHLKALLTFARKHVRDHHSQYLSHIPRTMHYIIEVSKSYPELAILHDFFVTTVQPAFQREVLCER